MDIREMGCLSKSRRRCEFFGDNIVYSNGKDWRKHRRAINQFFKKKWDAKLLVDQCIKFCNKVREISKDGSEKINPHILTEKLTLDMLGKLVFDIDFKELEEQHSKAAELYLQSMIIVNKPLYIIFPFLDRFRPEELEIVKQFDDMIESYIVERKKLLDGNKIDPENDALTALVNTSSENVTEDYRLTYKEMLWTFKILFVAGHDTTSMSLSGLLYHLAIYPEIQDKVRKEIQSNIKDINNISEEELKNLPYLEMVIKENLRLLPPLAVNLERINKTSATFQNYFLPPNTLLQTHFYHLMRSETHWKNPLEFIPERFQDCTMGQLKSWLPFSTGSRSCLGINLSLLEQKIFLVVVLNQFKVVWPSDIKNHTLKFGHIDLLYPTNLNLILENLN
ncbi:cytochrome P450 [Neoconidiobolus thromboides FSU 785]|nr:cytochrome P450 [Neoconidiobolus thromboides FSU 785]